MRVLVFVSVVTVVVVAGSIPASAQSEGTATSAPTSVDWNTLERITAVTATAMDGLAEGDLRKATVAYGASIKAVAQLADQVAEKSRQQGAVRTRLATAKTDAQRMVGQSGQFLSTAKSPQALADVRGQLLASISQLRSECQQATTEAERKRIGAKCQQACARLELLDELLSSWSAHQRLDNSLPVAGLLDRVELAEFTLPMDEQMFQLAATMVGETARQAHADFGQALVFISIGQAVPEDCLAETRALVRTVSGVMDNARGGRQWSLALARGQSTSELAMPVDSVQPVATLVSGSSARFSAEHLALAERLHQQMEPLLSKCLTQISPEALAMERRIGELTELEQLATNRGTPELMGKLTEVRQQLRLVTDDRRKLIANARPVQAGGGQLVGIESVGKR